ncbi:protein adenylyltransferase SelO [Pirellulaceae bacterium SH501]
MKFESRFVDSLPGDTSNDPRPHLVWKAMYSLVSPTPVRSPSLIAYSERLAKELGIDPDWIESADGVNVLAGNKFADGMKPYAMCYGGHQFGNWAGQLGDGRAINLGEWRDPSGNSWTWQLKGSGPTPYSRFADGRAVLRSSLREYLCSEAMHALGVPTTRALSLVSTGENVLRDMFYDGNAKHEPGAIVCRVAPSFIRFGNFEIFAARQDVENLRKLADFTIASHFPELGDPSLETYEAWFREVCLRTAAMVCDWMRVGFVHGVMNTDNMSILGLTIDYGPYGWIDSFDADWTPNTTDFEMHRYAFGNQPQIAQWNLVQLANALYPLFDQTEPLQRGLDTFVSELAHHYLEMQSAKLGLSDVSSPDAKSIIEQLENCWRLTEIDMTIFYRLLSHLPRDWFEDDESSGDYLIAAFCDCVGEAFYEPIKPNAPGLKPLWDWVLDYRKLVCGGTTDFTDRSSKMNRVNPKYVLRNYLAQEAIEHAERGDLGPLQELMDLLMAPYDEQPKRETKYFAKRPEWARHKPGCSTLSCSS